MMDFDFSVADHGSVVILSALSDAAQQWVAEHLADDALTWGPNGTVIEPRYVSDIVTAMIHGGLEGAAS